MAETFVLKFRESVDYFPPLSLRFIRLKKGEVFSSMVEEMHGGWVSEPQVAGNFISFGMGMDVTMKGGVGRMKMDEIAVYEVKDGKIVKEQFFF